MFLFPQAEGSKERGPSQPFQPDAWLPLGPLTLLLGRWALANFPGGIAFAPCRSDPGIWHDPVLRWIECHSRPLRNRPGQDQGDPSLGQPPPCHSLREPREVPAQALPATPAPIGFVHDPFSSLLCPPPPACLSALHTSIGGDVVGIHREAQQKAPLLVHCLHWLHMRQAGQAGTPARCPQPGLLSQPDPSFLPLPPPACGGGGARGRS